MLARRRRLTESRGFARVRQKGRACNHALFVVASLPNGTAETRIGFSVSKRVGGAVTRNLVKRRLRAASGPVFPALAGGHDIVVIARPALAQASFAVLSQDLRATLRRAGLLRASHEAGDRQGRDGQ